MKRRIDAGNPPEGVNLDTLLIRFHRLGDRLPIDLDLPEVRMHEFSPAVFNHDSSVGIDQNAWAAMWPPGGRDVN